MEARGREGSSEVERFGQGGGGLERQGLRQGQKGVKRHGERRGVMRGWMGEGRR